MPEPSPSPPSPGVLTVVLAADTADAIVLRPVAKRGKRRFGLPFWLAAGWLVALVTMATFADLLPFVRSPEKIYPAALREGPSTAFWFGGDQIGRDVFARTIYGARISLLIGVGTVALGLAVGGTLGLLAGYWRGRFESVVAGFADVMLAFPPLILALALVSFMGREVSNIILALAILAVPALIRITRAATLTFAQREFVLAARTLGASHSRIIAREILPNVVPPMASFALLAIAVVIVAEGALSFLGLSVPPPQPTWGSMISEGKDVLDTASHIALLPCAVMFLTLLALNYVGDKLRSLFDVKEATL